MKRTQPIRVKTISEFHKLRGLQKSQHPLISVLNFKTTKQISRVEPVSMTCDFYMIILKRFPNAKIKYGQKTIDFDEGIMGFMSPGQVFSLEIQAYADQIPAGWLLLVHPDFLWGTSLAKTIKQYEYFDYSVNEALWLSEKEQKMVIGILKYIEQEYHTNIDKFSQPVIISQLELLLNYSDRFYNRQFLTRKKANDEVLQKLENLLSGYFNNKNLINKGLPTVQFIATELNVSPNYLSNMLKVLTGKNALQHIQHKVIELAKEKLSTTSLSVSEIAYELGFDYSQSFSRLFKTKTSLSPLEFRASFN